MPAHTLSPWTARRIAARKRLEQVRVRYLLFLMVVTQSHSPDIRRFNHHC